jgi:hypothetical protein
VTVHLLDTFATRNIRDLARAGVKLLDPFDGPG